jgi:hypothetical protein
LAYLNSAADPLIFSPGFKLAAVFFFAIVGVGVPAGVYWLSGEQPGTGIAGDAAIDRLPGKARGLGGEVGRDADGAEKGSDLHEGKAGRGDANFSAHLALQDSKEDVASATRAFKIFSAMRRQYPSLVPGDSKLIPDESDAGIWFRAEFPFTTKEMADRFCEALKLNDRCHVVSVRRPGK